MGAELGGSLQQPMVGGLCCCFPQTQMPVGRRGPRSASLPHRTGGCSQSVHPLQTPPARAVPPLKHKGWCRMLNIILNNLQSQGTPSCCMSPWPELLPGSIPIPLRAQNSSLGASLISLHAQNSYLETFLISLHTQNSSLGASLMSLHAQNSLGTSLIPVHAQNSSLGALCWSVVTLSLPSAAADTDAASLPPLQEGRGAQPSPQQLSHSSPHTGVIQES